MGLYDDDDAAITSGDQNHEDYWWSKYYSITLDEALKSKQPEGAIGDFLKNYAVKAHDEALVKFPAHADIKAWREKATKISGKISPEASGYFQPNFPWFGGPGGSGGGNFGQWWVNYHHAKSAKDAGDWATAYEKAKYCSFRAEEINDMGPRGSKAKYSEEVQKFLTDSAVDAEAIFQDAKKHR